jgi:hypothetical protein
MKKTVLTIAGSALIVFSAVQMAAASEQHHRVHHRAYSEFRDTNAYVAPAPAPEAYRYSGGYSDMAGR